MTNPVARSPVSRRRIIDAVLIGVLATILTSWVCCALSHLLIGEGNGCATDVMTECSVLSVYRCQWFGARSQFCFAHPRTDKILMLYWPGLFEEERKDGCHFPIDVRGSFLRRSLELWGAGGMSVEEPGEIVWGEGSYGWPFEAMWFESDFVAIGGGRYVPMSIRGGEPFPPGTNPMLANGKWYCILPLRPIWPGFAANACLFGSAAYVLMFAPPALRRRSRQRRGCCSNCGYDLLGDLPSGCPECGWNRPDSPAN